MGACVISLDIPQFSLCVLDSTVICEATSALGCLLLADQTSCNRLFTAHLGVLQTYCRGLNNYQEVMVQ